jgi:methenyltetrahydromethanopterin cyclohydrolase
MTLNEQALAVVEDLVRRADDHRIGVLTIAGARVIDAGIQSPGGLQAGLALARICVSGRAEVSLQPGDHESVNLPIVQVFSDDPVRACLASQYAGWQIAVGKFFAMGSGPMRAHYGREELFDQIPGRETATVAVGVLEGRKLPSDEVIGWLSDNLQLTAGKLTLAIAPTASIAGTLQVVARSLETALHKLHELKFDVNQIVSGFGTAPLPPPANDDLAGIGRTNDAILYGGVVHLWVRCDDAILADIGPKVPASASSDYGQPFGEIFARAGHDFYKLDPMLFAPAVVTFHNLTTGRSFAFGRLDTEVMRKSFGVPT